VEVLEDADDLRAVELGLLEVEVLNRSVVGEEIATPQELGEEVDVAVILHEAVVVHLYRKVVSNPLVRAMIV
jgi:hypothetical protein